MFFLFSCCFPALKKRRNLNELHDQEELSGRFVHLDQLDDARMANPPQDRHLVFYQVLLSKNRNTRMNSLFKHLFS